MVFLNRILEGKILREEETCGTFDGRGRLPSRFDMARREKMRRKRKKIEMERKKGRERENEKRREKKIGGWNETLILNKEENIRKEGTGTASLGKINRQGVNLVRV